MLGRLLRSADFERALGRPACARSPHFALHFVPAQPAKALEALASAKLSTDDEQACSQPVDDLMLDSPGSAANVLLGAVVPKRHARRSVTRTLLKRLIRAAASRRAAPEVAPLPAGVWVVRLRAPFERAHFVSAASQVLRSTARAELDAVFESAQRRLGEAAAR